MASKSFLSKLADAILDRDVGESAADIDRRLEAELAEIRNQKQELLDGSGMLMEDWKTVCDLIYIMNLGPLFVSVGGRASMMGKRLPDACGIIFGRLVPGGEGHSRLKGDYFLMSFRNPSREAGFRRAAAVINEIGAQMIGERFKSIEIPDLLTAASPAELANDDGGFDPEKAKAQLEIAATAWSKGGPNADEPHWLKLQVRNESRSGELVRMSAAGRAAKPAEDLKRPRRRGDPDWVEQRTDRRKRISYDPMMMERRRGRDRRAKR